MRNCIGRWEVLWQPIPTRNQTIQNAAADCSVQQRNATFSGTETRNGLQANDILRRLLNQQSLAKASNCEASMTLLKLLPALCAA